VFIRHIFVVKPMIALALLICLGTIIALFRLNRRRPHNRSDQFLIGFLGLLAIYEGLKLLKDSGIVALGVNSMFDDAIELIVASTCLIAAVMLRMSRINHLEVESAIRLARAAPPRLARPDASVAQKETSILETLAWAVPRLSDGAYKLFVVLCLSWEPGSGRIPVAIADVQLRLGKSKEELDRCLKELQDSGVVALRRYGTTMDVEITGPAPRPPAPAPEQIAATAKLATEVRL